MEPHIRHAHLLFTAIMCSRRHKLSDSVCYFWNITAVLVNSVYVISLVRYTCYVHAFCSARFWWHMRQDHYTAAWSARGKVPCTSFLQVLNDKRCLVYIQCTGPMNFTSLNNCFQVGTCIRYICFHFQNYDTRTCLKFYSDCCSWCIH